jgi:hypothetical protein
MSHQDSRSKAKEDSTGFAYERVIADICDLDWSHLTRDDLTSVAWVYYYFSVQFPENLEVARSLYPDDDRLLQLDEGERDTDNLSPFPGVAGVGERTNHDEFMRRTLELTPIAEGQRRRLEAIGQSYLMKSRAAESTTKVLSIASYEDGGLERVFGASESQRSIAEVKVSAHAKIAGRLYMASRTSTSSRLPQTTQKLSLGTISDQ